MSLTLAELYDVSIVFVGKKYISAMNKRKKKIAKKIILYKLWDQSTYASFLCSLILWNISCVRQLCMVCSAQSTTDF